MGLLSSLGNVVKGVASTLGKVAAAVVPTPAKIQNVGAVLNAAFNPLSKDKVVANVSNPTAKKVLETVANHPIVSAGVVAAPISIARSPVVASAAVNIVKSVAPTTTLGKVATVAAVPVVAGAIIQEPTKVASAAVALPSNLANFGGNVAKFAAEPSLETAKTIVKENPIITAGAVAATAVAVGAGTAGLVASVANTQAIKENTKVSSNPVVVNTTPNIPAGVSAPPGTGTSNVSALPATNTASAGSLQPVTPATQKLYASAGTSTSKTRKKRSIKPPMQQNIRQSVNVVVANKNIATTERLIKREVLMN